MKRLLFIAFLLITQIAYAGNIGSGVVGSVVSFIGQPVVSGQTITGNTGWFSDLYLDNIALTPFIDAPADGSTYGRNNNAWAVAGGTGSGPHLHPQYTPLADYSIHTHPNYAPAGSYANATHSHSIYDTEIQAVAAIATTNQHAGSYATPTQVQAVASIATTNQHGESYPTISSLSGVANTLGNHQHNVSYPSATQFQLLSQIATTNQHSSSYADINHQHSAYATGASLGTVANTLGTHAHAIYDTGIQAVATIATTNTHPNYQPTTTYANTHPYYATLSDYSAHNHAIYQTNIQVVASNLGTHQHNVSYPSMAQFQALSQIATTNTHAVASTTATGFAPIRSGNSTEYLDGSGAYSTPTVGATGHTHPVATTLLTGFAPILPNNNTLFLDGTGNYSTPTSTATAHQHDAFYPSSTQFQALSSIATTNSHSNYATSVDLGLVADTLGEHQHNVSYPSAAQFQLLSAIATTNQHNSTYATPAQVQAVAAIATTNSHAGYYATPSSLEYVANLLGTHTHSNYAALTSSNHFVAAVAIETNYLKVNNHILITCCLADHTANGITIIGGAGETLTFGDLVYFKNDGKYWKAKANSQTTIPVQGMALGAATSSQHVAILVQGFVRDASWSLRAGVHILVSPWVSGAWTHPWTMAKTGDQVQIVGYGYGGDTMYFNPDSTYIEI